MKYFIIFLLLFSANFAFSQDYSIAYSNIKDAITKVGPIYRGLYFKYKVILDSASNKYIFTSESFDEKYINEINTYLSSTVHLKSTLPYSIIGEGKFDEFTGEVFFDIRKYNPNSYLSWDDFYSPNYPYGGYPNIIENWYDFLKIQYNAKIFEWKNIKDEYFVDFYIDKKGEVSSLNNFGIAFLKKYPVRFTPGYDNRGTTSSIMRLKIPKYNDRIDGSIFYKTSFDVRFFELGRSNEIIKNIIPLDSLGENVFYTRSLSDIYRDYTVVSVVRDEILNKYVSPIIHRGNIEKANNLTYRLVKIQEPKHSGGSYTSQFDRVYFYTE